MQAFHSRLLVLPVAAALGLGSGLAFAQSAAPAATDKAAVQKLVKPAGMSDRTMTKNDVAKMPETRNWAKADANGDHSVSPDEMEAYLKANPGPLAAKK